jgi:hypothetical protein
MKDDASNDSIRAYIGIRWPLNGSQAYIEEIKWNSIVMS